MLPQQLDIELKLHYVPLVIHMLKVLTKDALWLTVEVIHSEFRH